MTYEQCPKILYKPSLRSRTSTSKITGALTFHECGAAYRNLIKGREPKGPATITMQLAWQPFLDRSDRSFRRKCRRCCIAADRAAVTRSRKFLPCTPTSYLAAWEVRIRRTSQFISESRHRPELRSRAACGNGARAYLVARTIRSARWAPESGPAQNAGEGKITPSEEAAAKKTPAWAAYSISTHDLAPYFSRSSGNISSRLYGTEAVHERGRAVYTR